MPVRSVACSSRITVAQHSTLSEVNKNDVSPRCTEAANIGNHRSARQGESYIACPQCAENAMPRRLLLSNGEHLSVMIHSFIAYSALVV